MHRINFDEVQKAMEDIEREAFDYFLDTQTGEVVILSEEILARAEAILTQDWDDDMADYDAVEFDDEVRVPDWAEDEVELALDIFLDHQERYERIPERGSDFVFTAMKEFVGSLAVSGFRSSLAEALEGKGVFRRFKDLLEDHPKERKQWYGYSAKMARKEITEWLESIGMTTDLSDRLSEPGQEQ